MCGDDSARNLPFIQAILRGPPSGNKHHIGAQAGCHGLSCPPGSTRWKLAILTARNDKFLMSRCLGIDTWPMRFRRIANLNSFTSTNCERPSACSLLLEKSKVGGMHYHHGGDRKSTRLNSSHQIISYAVFCLKKKKKS